MAAESNTQDTAVDLPATVIGEGADASRDPFAEAAGSPVIPAGETIPVAAVPDAPESGLAFDLLVAMVLLQLILLALALTVQRLDQLRRDP